MASERSEQPVTPEHLVLVTPIAPAPGGNGLAMRAGTWLDALAARHPVHVVIVPVAGSAVSTAWAEQRAQQIVVVGSVDPATAQKHVVAQLGDPFLRPRLEQTAPLPIRASHAPPTLASVAADELGADAADPVAVVSMREYLAPFGITLARHLRAPRVVVDLDDDAEHLLTELGDDVEAQAYGRLNRAWLPDAAAITVASPIDAARVAGRYALSSVESIPNAVPMFENAPPAPGQDRVLFVGNLTYEPNIDAARFLVDEILPRLRELRPEATVEIVGPYDDRLRDLATMAHVRLPGFVPELAPRYADADVVVAPLRTGSGTRLKVLEAFAYQRPVVTTAAAVTGLVVQEGVDVLIAESPESIAAAVARLLEHPELARTLVDGGSLALTSRYTPGVVGPLIRRVAVGNDDDS